MLITPHTGNETTGSSGGRVTPITPINTHAETDNIEKPVFYPNSENYEISELTIAEPKDNMMNFDEFSIIVIVVVGTMGMSFVIILIII